MKKANTHIFLFPITVSGSRYWESCRVLLLGAVQAPCIKNGKRTGVTAFFSFRQYPTPFYPSVLYYHGNP